MEALNLSNLNNDNEQETQALRELNDFLSTPNQSTSMDNLKESLRNMLELWIEVKGYSTGRDLQHLVNDEHSSLAVAGTLRSDRERKKKRDYAQALEDIEHLMKHYFDTAYEYVQKRIEVIKTGIDIEIEKLDQRIEEEADTEMEAQAIKASSSKRRKLVRFKKHIEEHEEELEEADTTLEILEIEKNIVEDLHDFKAGRFTPNKPRPNPLYPISDILNSALPINDPIYDNHHDIHDDISNTQLSNDTSPLTGTSALNSSEKTDESGSGSQGSAGDTSGSGDTTGSDDSGAGDNEEDTRPPPPSIDL